MKEQNQNLEDIIFQYIDKIKVLITPETWSNVLLDCSKNELFTLFFVYRKTEVNMSQIAEYIAVPLNTVTGIVSRMEKKKLLARQHSTEDKRVVTVRITKEGLQYIKEIINEILYYGQKVIECLSAEEFSMLFRIIDKIITVLETVQKEKMQTIPEKKMKKILIE